MHGSHYRAERERASALAVVAAMTKAADRSASLDVAAYWRSMAGCVEDRFLPVPTVVHSHMTLDDRELAALLRVRDGIDDERSDLRDGAVAGFLRAVAAGFDDLIASATDVAQTERGLSPERLAVVVPATGAGRGA